MKILKFALRPAFALLVASIAINAIGKPAAPVGLLVDDITNPLAVDQDAVRFTWRSAGNHRGETQTGYQILVASNPDKLTAGIGDWWDSGQVDSAQSAALEYSGKSLPPASRFWWEVRTWDQTGKPSGYSSRARFDTGLAQNNWAAQYIWDGTTNTNNFAYFRKTFLLAERPDLAKVYVTAQNDYILYCNGQLLGRGPARSDPYHYGQYNSYDITKLLKSGTNVFAAMGHWLGTFHDSGCNGLPAFLLEAKFDQSDGSSSIIGTDKSWKVLAHTAFIETNATFFGWTGGQGNRAEIQYDARLEPKGWRAVDFDDSGWASATTVDRSNYHLFAQMAPLEREQAAIKPVSISHTNNSWLVDFGRCLDGWPKLTMRANQPGETIRVEYFQRTGERNRAGWDQYTCRGGKETWEAGFGRHTTFQVLKITGYAGELKAADVRGMWAYCDADVTGRFNCSSPLLNAIYEMCERSARQNIQQGIISVDANREQSPWLADSWNIGNVLLYNHQNTMMIDKVVRDYAAEQLTNGNFYACSPSPMFQIAEWSMYWPMLMWQQYLFSGDKTLLREMSPRLGHFLEWLKDSQDQATGLPNPPGWRISDWAVSHLPKGGINVATSSQYYENLRIASRIFLVLGQTNQSDEYARHAEEVKASINANLFNGKFYLARTDTNVMFPLASTWPLRFDIEPPAAKSQILAIIEQAGRPVIGGYGGDSFYSGLLNAGDGAYVIPDLARYRPMLEGNRVNWEQFDDVGEVNHAWTAYPGYIFLKYISGVQPASGGFATFDVRPEMGGLDFAEGTVPTVKGLITTGWKKNPQGGFSLSIHVPANTRASIYLPKLIQENFTITESGKQLWPATSENVDPGVQTLSETDRAIECRVGAGDYRFIEAPASSRK